MLLLFILLTSVSYSSSQYNFRLSENRAPNTFVGQILIKTGFKYDFYDKGNMFLFSENSGMIHTRVMIDRESLESELISLLVYERQGSVFARTISISVRITDENDNKPVFLPSMVTRTVVENVALLTEISLPTATDRDSDEFGLRYDYRIESGNDEGRFRLVGGEGDGQGGLEGRGGRGHLSLQVVRALDREVRALYNVNISVHDKGQPPLSGHLLVRIIVEDYNDNGPVFSPSKYTVHINDTSQATASATIVTVHASDADAGLNSRVSYRFKKTQTSRLGEFALNGDTGEITLISPLVCHTLQPRCLLVIEAYDHGVPSLSAVCHVTLAIVRRNSHSPRLRISYVQMSHSPHFSNTAYLELDKITRRPLAIIQAEDEDNPDDPITVTILATRLSTIFTLHRTHGNLFILRQVIKTTNEHPRTFTISLLAIDNGSPRKESRTVIRIHVNDKNMHRPQFNAPHQEVTITNDIPVYSFIKRLQALDQDLGLNGYVTYVISSGNKQDIFYISPSSGLLTLQHTLMFTNLFYFNLTIVAKDSGINSLQSSTILIIRVTRSIILRARFRRATPTTFVLNNQMTGNQGLFFVHNFFEDIEISDQTRLKDIDMFVLNSHLRIVNNSLFLANICSLFGVHSVTIILSTASTELDKISITISSSPRLVSKMCWSKEFVYAKPLPTIFSYNEILINLADTMPFNGTFLPLSSLEDFYLSSDGRIYWKKPSAATIPHYVINLLYTFMFRQFSLSRNITVIFHSSPSTHSLFNCPRLQSTITSVSTEINLTKFLLKDQVSFGLSEQWMWYGSYISSSQHLFFHRDSSISLIAHNANGFQSCELIFEEKAALKFPKDYFYLRSEENQKGAKIGEIKVDGFFDSSRFSTKLSGQHASLFTVIESEWSLYLIESVTKSNNLKIFNLSLSIHDTKSQISLAAVDIFVEFFSMSVSAVFVEAYYTFIVPEDASTHTPLRRVALVSSQTYIDFEFYIPSNLSRNRWAIFPDGSLYITSNLDFEQCTEYSLEVVAVNRIDTTRRTSIPIRILIEDVNDNTPTFTLETYYFDITITSCVSNRMGYVIAVDDDSGNNGLVEYTLSGAGPGIDLVQIDPYTGLLSITGCMLDTIEYARLTVNATDWGSPRRSSAASVYIKARLIEPMKIEFISNNYVVAENSTIGSVIGKVETRYCKNVRYTSVRSNGKTVFELNNITGDIVLRGTLDREKVSRYSMTILASCPMGRLTGSSITHIFVADINDNRPVFLAKTLTNIVVPESLKVGSVLATYSATDIDAGANGMVKYRLSTTQFEQLTIFRIDVSTGVLYLNRGLDYEYKSRWYFNVTAFDGGDPSLDTTIQLVVEVTNDNDNKPFFVDDGWLRFTMTDDVELGTIIGRVTAQDPDNNPLIYALGFVDPSAHPFTVNRSLGIITYSGPSVRAKSYHLSIMAIDALKNHWFVVQDVEISVISKVYDIIEVMTYGAVILPSTLFVGDKIATVQALVKDRKDVGRLIYSVVNKSMENIAVNSHTGDLYLRSLGPLDFNFIDVTISIRYKQSSSPPEKVDTIHSTKLIRNHGNSYNLNFQKNEYVINIAENETLKGTKLLRVHALYPGNPIANLEYFITDIYMGISSIIRLPRTTVTLDSGSGWLSVGNADIDKEEIEGCQITVEVLVLDSGRNASRICSTKVFINILDHNDNPPVFTNVTYVFHTPEHVSSHHRWLIGRVQALDRDMESDIVYDWVRGNHSYFALDRHTGEIRTTAISIDYEQVSSLWLVVRVSDGIYSSTADVLILIEDINDHGPQFINDTFQFQCPENVPVNTIIGQIMATDPDNVETARIRYSLISDWGSGIFSVHPDHGIISSVSEIDYEQGSHYLLLVTATDTGLQSQISPVKYTVTATVVVVIVNENDNPPLFVNKKINVSISEEAQEGTIVARVAAFDKDVQDILQFEISSSNEERFAIDHLRGILTLIGRLDYENRSSHVISVSCTDGLFSAVAIVTVYVVNINDIPPVIHNTGAMLISITDQKQSHFIHCTDRDNLGPLHYGFRGDSSFGKYLRVDTVTGEISRRRSTSVTLRGEFLCSDGKHTTSKNVTIRLIDKHPKINNVTVKLASKNPEDHILLTSEEFRKRVPSISQQYNFFLGSSEDRVFFDIDQQSGELSSRQYFVATKPEYILSILSIPILGVAPHANVDITVTYNHLASCHPKFVGTPYSFKIFYPVTKSRILGSATVKYCPQYTTEYYLNSGHSYFNVNISTGSVRIHKTPPQGHYQYKLTAVIYGLSKAYISTTFTVLTTDTSTNHARCQYIELRLFVSMIAASGTELGRVMIKDLPTDVDNISFKLRKPYPFSVDNQGRLLLIQNLSALSKRTFQFNVTVTWSRLSLEHLLTCPTVIEVFAPTNRCTLSLMYPGSSLDLKTSTNIVSGSFIFSLPIAHVGCTLKSYETKFQTSDSNFAIDSKMGNITSRSMLLEGKYPITVMITSPTASNTLAIPINIFAVPRLKSTELIFKKKVYRYEVPSNTSPGTVLGTMIGEVIPANLRPLLRYSIVMFCCAYEDNIAVYNGSIYQSPFHLTDLSGLLSVQGALSSTIDSYRIIVRASIMTTSPRSGYTFEDIDVMISVNVPQCACKHKLLEGTILEESRVRFTVVDNVLVWYKDRALNITVEPESVRTYLTYDITTNSILKTNNPIDYESINQLEFLLTVRDGSNVVLRCPGVVTILDVNDNSPRFLRNYFIGQIVENSSPDTWIVNVDVTDRDSSKFPLSFSLSGDGSYNFRIDRNNGSVFSTKKLDREERDRYNLKVSVSDGVHALETGMLITVLDVNDNSPQVAAERSNSTIVINRSKIRLGDRSVVTISATDGDDSQSNNSKLFCVLAPSRTDVLARKIMSLNRSTCHVTIVSKYTDLISPNLTVTIEVVVSDKGDPPLTNHTILIIHFVDETREIRILNKIYQHPIAVLHTSTNGIRLFTLQIINKHQFVDVLFDITHGNGTSAFTIDSATGNISTKIHFKQLSIGTWYSLHVCACGINRESIIRQCSNSVQINLVITDFNLYSPDIRVDPSTVYLAENIEIGRKVAKVRIFDNDDGIAGMLEVKIVGPTKQLFALVTTVDIHTFVVVTSAHLDYETQSRHTITMVVSDLGSPRRSATATLVVMVTDINDNTPYFYNNNLIIKLSSPQSMILLPLALDDDANTTFKENLYSVSPSDVMELRYSENRIIGHLNRPYWNASLLSIILSVYSVDLINQCNPCSTLSVHLIIESTLVNQINCAPDRTSQSPPLQYHLLMVHPRLSRHLVNINPTSGEITKASGTLTKEIIFVTSLHKPQHLQYKVCYIKVNDHSKVSASQYTLRLPHIVLGTIIAMGTVVGRIEVLNYRENVSKKFYFNLQSDSFLPFHCLNQGDVIVTSRLTYAPVYTKFNVTVMASYRNRSSVVDNLRGEMMIVVGSNNLTFTRINTKIKVREIMGNGIVLGRIQKLLNKSTTESFVLEGLTKSPLVMDNRGILRVIGVLDRELFGQFSMSISSRQTRVMLSIFIEDENDNFSVARKTNIFLHLDNNVENVGRVARLVPVDKDIMGNYQCRLASFVIPRGVLLTQDCWLYITESLIVSNKTNVFTVIHHDGIHHAVKSNFHLEIYGRYFHNQHKEWVLLLLSSFESDALLPKLRLLKVFMYSIGSPELFIGLNPQEHYIIIQANTTNGYDLIKVLRKHTIRIRDILKVEGIEFFSDICNVDSCDFHGVCSSVLRVDYEQMFSDDDQLPLGAIHIYPLMVVTRTCVCRHGYLGLSCNMTATCPYQICHNGGSCGQDISGRNVCECSTGFAGDRCDQDVNECHHGDLCGPQGKCVNILGGYKCECNLEWSGTSDCKKPFNACQSNPCSAPGTIQCIPFIGGFKCRCAFGYYGEKCALSAISITTQSSIQWELSHINTVLFEFATISQNAPLIDIVFSSTLRVKVTIVMSKIRLLLVRNNQILHQRQSNIDVSVGTWMKVGVAISIESVSIHIVACGDLGDCDTTNTVYGGMKQSREIIEITTTARLSWKPVILVLGNDPLQRSYELDFFVGCIRNLDMGNISVISKKEINVLYDSCPRFIDGVAPCGNAVERCGLSGNCVDEWFHGRCICPEGYQPPSCSPGYVAFSLAPNTIVSFVQRSEFVSKRKRREKRQVIESFSEMSLKIKTRDVNSIVLLSFSSLHTYTLLQISSGLIKVLDKFAGSSQEITHNALIVNDNMVHTVTINRFHSGRISVTVDSVVATVEWVQSHDPLGSSVQTIYLAGVPQADRTEELLTLPNYSGCLSEIRFNNGTQPLNGLTERFNVSLVQGGLSVNCSSDVCRRANICGKYQICQELVGVAHSHWGSYHCINDESHRLLYISILVFVPLIVAPIALVICLMRRRSKRLKAKSQLTVSDSRSKLNKKYKSSNSSQQENIDILHAPSKGKPSRSATSNTLLMQDNDRGDISRPDLLCSHPALFRQQWSSGPQCSEPYYQDTIVNSYMSTSQADSRFGSTKLNPRMGSIKPNNQKLMNMSRNTMKTTDDSLVYRCSHPDEYEAMSSQQSSNSQETIGLPGYNLRHNYIDRLPINIESLPLSHLKKPGLSSSSSGNSQLIPCAVHPILVPSSRNRHKSDDVFSNNDSTFTPSLQVEESNDSLSSRDSGHNNVFTPTNSSDSLASHTRQHNNNNNNNNNNNDAIRNSSSCWRNIQRALPPPPQSEEQYGYSDIKPLEHIIS